MNYVVWETLDAFRSAFGDPDFQAKLADYPPSVAIAPHVFHSVAVFGICTA